MKYDLVFEGGGAKGMVFVGALEVFEAAGYAPGRLLGTSAGAITAALLAAGYTAEEMLAALAEKKNGQPVFATFMGDPRIADRREIQNSAIRALLHHFNVPWIPDRVEEPLDDAFVRLLATHPYLRHIFSFVEYGGWYVADDFVAWLRRRLDTGSYRGCPRRFSGMTLAQFYEATGVDLSLIAADTTEQEMLVLNHRTAPELPIVWAVRMSMSIPLLWQEVVWQAGWGGYRDREKAGHTIVDGGVLSNFPLELFVSNNPKVTQVMGPKAHDNVMGLLIDDTLPVPGAEPGAPPEKEFDLGDLQTARRITKLLNTMMSAHDKMVLAAFDYLVVHLPAKGYGTVEFDMSEERREKLIAAGRDAMQEHLDSVLQPKNLAVPEEAVGAEPPPFLSSLEAQEMADRVALKLLER